MIVFSIPIWLCFKGIFKGAAMILTIFTNCTFACICVSSFLVCINMIFTSSIKPTTLFHLFQYVHPCLCRSSEKLQWSQNHVQLKKIHASVGQIHEIWFDMCLCYREKELHIEGEFWLNYLHYLKASLLIRN